MMNTWVTVEEADAYFSLRLGAQEYWTEEVHKEAALATAQKQILACGLFALPEVPAQAMKDGVCEQALFLLIHGSGVDRRLGLQELGVGRAGLIDENYRPRDGIALAAQVRALLAVYAIDRSIGLGYINRWRA